MLRHLHIRNYILLDSLDVTFPEGLVIITGQTGAGKSILLGALGLLAGGKADANQISKGAETCVVEGEFETPEGLRTVRRVLYSSGRSRSFIDDCPVQLQELSDLGARLFDIHSQHQSLLLTDRTFQLGLLDRWCSATGELAECRSLWSSLSGARKELAELREKLSRSNAEADWNASCLEELEAAALRDGELEELEEEQLALGNAEEILQHLSEAENFYSGDDGRGVRDALRQSRKSLEHAAKYLPGLDALTQRLESAAIELDDIYSELTSAAERVEASPRRLEQVEQRLSLIYRLLGKYGCSSVADLIAAKERFAGEVSDNGGLRERIEALSKECARLQADYDASCKRLHALREVGRGSFAAKVTEGLRYLELERASFEVALTPAAPGPSGTDAVSFNFSADGTAPTEIGKCASGGELSRIMLSLKAVMAQFEGMPTLIFDEIDTGVSGSVAAKMGRMICEMSRTTQVFSITHLPQVAARGSAHYVVSKSFDGERTRSGISLVEGEDRVMEIARLLSGENISAEAIANARVLLAEAPSER